VITFFKKSLVLYHEAEQQFTTSCGNSLKKSSPVPDFYAP